MSSKSLISYDLIPYPNFSFPQTHPDRAAVIAKLLGLEPPPVEHCRVLELGCAAGSNLIPMAEELPQSTFVGIDLSRRQISEGQQAIAELGLTNIELRHQSVLDFESGSGTFDYILCHGVFSWVPPEVQDRILAISRQSLAPSGVAYVSYNTLPGWHMRGMIRDMMLYHSRRFSDPQQQVAQARSLLDFLVASVPMQENPYGQYLRSELEGLRGQADSYLYHDHLEEHNHPLYFHQFVERAAAHGLRYLADADLSTMDSRNLPQQVAQTLERASTDLIQLEQYMDFLRNRTFRQSLLCHAQHTPRYQLEPDVLAPLFLGSALQPASPSPDLNPSIREDFRGHGGSFAFSNSPIVKAALLTLGEVWPLFLPFQELCSQARAKLHSRGIAHAATTREDEQELGQAVLRYCTIASNLVEFRLRPLRVTTQPGSRPLARPLARWQARSRREVTNLRHESVTLDAFGRQALLRLDGQHTRTAVVQELAALVESGQLVIQQQEEKVTNPQVVAQVVHQALEQLIEQLARLALFPA
jgi:methyltransferase-like protein/SAM-dependent methyltransferase